MLGGLLVLGMVVGLELLLGVVVFAKLGASLVTKVGAVLVVGNGLEVGEVL